MTVEATRLVLPPRDGVSATAGVRRSPIRHVLRPFQEFARLEAASGILLIAAAIVALVWANSPWADSYFGLWQTRLSLGGGDFLSKSLLLWINDGLMAVFFVVVALEVKRELIGGELAHRRRAMLPIAAAFGGMIVPAALYLAFNIGTPEARGWGIPMATDIAFALGVLMLLGKRVPLALKLFLTALAIVDDIGAVLVIALFYTADLSLSYLGGGALVLLALAGANLFGVRRLLVYGVLGVVLWYMCLRSGVHATVAGVLLAMAIPSSVGRHPSSVAAHVRAVSGRLVGPVLGKSRGAPQTGRPARSGDSTPAHDRRDSPMRRLEHALHPLVTFGILPLFALANAGVTFGGAELVSSLLHPVGFGVLFGLAVGKQVGITLAAWMAVRVGLAQLPHGIGWWHIYGAAWLGGIGFTMSIFIGGLAFSDPTLLDTTKRAIFAASVISGLAGWLVLHGAIGRSKQRAMVDSALDQPPIRSLAEVAVRNCDSHLKLP